MNTIMRHFTTKLPGILIGIFLFMSIQSAHTVGFHSHIYSALRTLDIIKESSEDNPDNEQLAYLKGLFFNGDNAKDDFVKAFVRGALLPEFLRSSYTYTGEYVQYCDTALFYYSLLRKSGTDNKINAFALGALLHYIFEKEGNQVLRDFSGGVYGLSADHEVYNFDLNTGEVLGGIDDPDSSFPRGYKTMKMQLFLELYMVKKLLMSTITSANTTPSLADDGVYYTLSDFTAGEYALFGSVYQELWEEDFYPADMVMYKTDIQQFMDMLEYAHETNQHLTLTSNFLYLPLKGMGFPSAAEVAKFEATLATLKDIEGKSFRAILSVYESTLGVIIPNKARDVYTTISGYVENGILAALTIPDLGLTNVNLDSGELATSTDNSMHNAPDLMIGDRLTTVKALITNRGDDTVTVIDINQDVAVAGDFSVNTSFPVGMKPQRIIIDRSGQVAYISHLNSTMISCYDIELGTEIMQYALTGVPKRMALCDANKTMYVITDSSNTIEVVDLVNNTTIASIIPDIVGTPTDVVISPSGDTVYVSLWDATESMTYVVLIDSYRGPGTDPAQSYNTIIDTLEVNGVPTDKPDKKRSLGMPKSMTLDASGKDLFILHDRYKTLNFMSRINLADDIFDYRKIYIPKEHDPTNKDLGGCDFLEREIRPGKNKLFTSVYPTMTMLAPAMISQLVYLKQFNPPGIASYLDRGHEAVMALTFGALFAMGLYSPGLTALTVGIGATMPIVYSVHYYGDPLFLNNSIAAAAPPVTYQGLRKVENLMFAGFISSGNIGFFDRTHNYFLTSTFSPTGPNFKYAMRPALMDEKPENIIYSDMAVSTIGDVIAVNYAEDEAHFYYGDELFQYLDQTNTEVMFKTAIDQTTDTYKRRNIIGLNDPSGVDIQPVVYIMMPFLENSGKTEQANLIIVSRKDISDIKLYAGPDRNELIPIGGFNTEWTRQTPRYWELIINDVNSRPFSGINPEELCIEITLANGAIVSLNDAPSFATDDVTDGDAYCDLDLENVPDAHEDTKGGFISTASAALTKLSINLDPKYSDYKLVKLEISSNISYWNDYIKFYVSTYRINEVQFPLQNVDASQIPSELWIAGSGDPTRLELTLTLTCVVGNKTLTDVVKIVAGTIFITLNCEHNPDRVCYENQALGIVPDTSTDIDTISLKASSSDNALLIPNPVWEIIDGKKIVEIKGREVTYNAQLAWNDNYRYLSRTLTVKFYSGQLGREPRLAYIKVYPNTKKKVELPLGKYIKTFKDTINKAPIVSDSVEVKSGAPPTFTIKYEGEWSERKNIPKAFNKFNLELDTGLGVDGTVDIVEITADKSLVSPVPIPKFLEKYLKLDVKIRGGGKIGASGNISREEIDDKLVLIGYLKLSGEVTLAIVGEAMLFDEDLFNLEITGETKIIGIDFQTAYIKKPVFKLKIEMGGFKISAKLSFFKYDDKNKVMSGESAGDVVDIGVSYSHTGLQISFSKELVKAMIIRDSKDWEPFQKK